MCVSCFYSLLLKCFKASDGKSILRQTLVPSSEPYLSYFFFKCDNTNVYQTFQKSKKFSLSHKMLVCDMSQNDLCRCYDVRSVACILWFNTIMIGVMLAGNPLAD